MGGSKVLWVASAVLTFGFNGLVACGSGAGADNARERPPEPNAKYLSAPLDLNSRNVGPHFNGNNIDAIAARVYSAFHPKDEFETSQEYVKRKARFSSQLLVGSIKPDSDLAFVQDDDMG